MGILSTFCVAVPSLILERLTSAKDNELARIWTAGENYFWIGCGLLLVSAALFYKQRSLLAFYYGRIAFSGSPPSFAHRPNLQHWQWRDWADAWTTWIPYHIAFWTAMAGGYELILGCLPQARLFLGHYAIILFGVIITVSIFVNKDRPILFRCNPWIECIRERLSGK